MIGMPGKYRCGPEQLFHQHGAGEQMRPGRLAERQQQVCLVPFLLRVPVCRAEHETAFAHPAIAPLFEHFGEFLGRQVLALFIEQDSAKRRLRIRDAPAGFGQFGELYGPCDALFITRNQLRLGRTGNLSASDDMEKDGGSPLAPLPPAGGVGGGSWRKGVPKGPPRCD